MNSTTSTSTAIEWCKNPTYEGPLYEAFKQTKVFQLMESRMRKYPESEINRVVRKWRVSNVLPEGTEWEAFKESETYKMLKEGRLPE